MASHSLAQVSMGLASGNTGPTRPLGTMDVQGIPEPHKHKVALFTARRSQ